MEFKQWLPLAVGKRRMLAEATRKKALHYMAGITYLLDPTSVDESKVLDASNVESKLEELASNTGLGPSGFLARIDALIHFVRFLLYKAERAVSLPSCSSSSSSNVQTLQFVLGQYRCIRTNREKDRKRQDNFVREQEEEADLDNEAVTQIVTSPTIREKALSVTSQAKASGKRPSRTDSVFVTRYLFAVLIYRNAQRPGAVVNMTLSELKRGRQLQRDKGGQLEVKVFKHKTAQAGPAYVTVPDNIAPILAKYVKYVRPETRFNQVLILSSGHPVRTNNASANLARLGRSLGISLPSATTSRKTASSINAAKLSQDDASKTAALMSHSTDTASRYYRNIGARQRREETFRLMQKAQGFVSSSSSSSSSSSQAEDNANGNLSACSSSTSIASLPPPLSGSRGDEQESSAEETANGQLSACSSATSIASLPPPLSPSGPAGSAPSTSPSPVDSPVSTIVLPPVDWEMFYEPYSPVAKSPATSPAREDDVPVPISAALWSNAMDQSAPPPPPPTRDAPPPIAPSPPSPASAPTSVPNPPTAPASTEAAAKPKRKRKRNFSAEEDLAILSKHSLAEKQPKPAVFQELLKERTEKECLQRWKNLRKESIKNV